MFNIGDRVRCVHEAKIYDIHRGSTYVVEDTREIGRVQQVKLSGSPYFLCAHRFELVSISPVQNTRTIVIGTYGPIDVHRYDPANDVVSIKINADPMKASDIREAIKHLTEIADFMSGVDN